MQAKQIAFTACCSVSVTDCTKNIILQFLPALHRRHECVFIAHSSLGNLIILLPNPFWLTTTPSITVHRAYDLALATGYIFAGEQPHLHVYVYVCLCVRTFVRSCHTSACPYIDIPTHLQYWFTDRFTYLVFSLNDFVNWWTSVSAISLLGPICIFNGQ